MLLTGRFFAVSTILSLWFTLKIIGILTKRPRSFWSATGIGTAGDEVVLEISRLLFRLKLALVNINYVFAHFKKVFKKVKGPPME